MACANSPLPQASGQSVPITDFKQVRFFAQIERAVLASPDLTGNDKAVYAAIASYRNRHSGFAWPGRDTLATATGLHRNSVSRCAARLEKAGFITVEHKGGNRAYYRLPLADAREGTKATPSASKPRKRRARPEAPALSEAGCNPAVSSHVYPENSPPSPHADLAPAGPERPRGEFPAPHSPDLEPQTADQPSEQAHQAASERRQAAKASKNVPSHRLAFPEGLPALLCVQLGRMLASTPEAVAQELLDEMAFNARCHPIRQPGAYLRSLLNRHQRGEFSPEVAHFERERREHIQANQRAQQIAEQRHLAALAQGQLPASPPIVIERTADAEAQARLALAQARLALKGALLSPEQREQARLAYLASKPAAPTPAPAQHQGEDEQRALDFFASIKASLGIKSGHH
jgi:hypothetical protein